MQPAAGRNAQQQPSAAAVGSSAFTALAEQDVLPDARFFHKYYRCGCCFKAPLWPAAKPGVFAAVSRHGHHSSCMLSAYPYLLQAQLPNLPAESAAEGGVDHQLHLDVSLESTAAQPHPAATCRNMATALTMGVSRQNPWQLRLPRMAAVSNTRCLGMQPCVQRQQPTAFTDVERLADPSRAILKVQLPPGSQGHACSGRCMYTCVDS